jgi:hypothetical protein
MDKYFGGVAGKIIMICRCMTGSAGNEDAIHDPIIVGGVASSLDARFLDRGLALIEAFDQIPSAAILETMRDLDLFSERSVSVTSSATSSLRSWSRPPGMAVAKASGCPKKGRSRRSAVLLAHEDC